MTYADKLKKWELRRNKFKEQRRSGWTLRRIAEANGLSVQRVLQIVGKLNEPDIDRSRKVP